MGEGLSGRRRCPRCGGESGELYCRADGCATMLAVPAERLPTPRGGLIVGGRYRLVERVGQGAHGVVFSASHVLTGQPAAVKLLAQAQEFDAIRRFLTEAQAMARLDSPNTVHVRDFGQDDSGLVYLAMELLSGRTLRAELDRRQARGRRVEADEVVWLAEGVLASLVDAHARGLVHRDLKPSNVYLHLGVGATPVVKVCDFGVVKVLDGGLSTHDHARGTPAYMSPEQATPGAPIDGRSDLYSLGVILYELLTGRRPFHGDNALQLMRSHSEVEVPPIQDAHVPPALAALVMRALAKRPDGRFADARAMAEAVRALGVEPRAVGLDRDDATATVDPPARAEAALASLDAPALPAANGSRRREAPTTREVSLEVPRPRARRWVWALVAAGAALALALGGASRLGPSASVAPSASLATPGTSTAVRARPESSRPESSRPESSRPEFARPDLMQPDAARPEPAVEPTDAKPTDPGAAEPRATAPRPRRPAPRAPAKAEDTLPFPIER